MNYVKAIDRRSLSNGKKRDQAVIHVVTTLFLFAICSLNRWMHQADNNIAHNAHVAIVSQHDQVVVNRRASVFYTLTFRILDLKLL